jgi:hypothetical protein
MPSSCISVPWMGRAQCRITSKCSRTRLKPRRWFER